MNETYAEGMRIIEQRKSRLGTLALDHNDGLDEISAERAKVLADTSTLNKAKTLAKIISEYKRSITISHIVDKYFPLVLGAIAIGVSIWASFIR